MQSSCNDSFQVGGEKHRGKHRGKHGEKHGGKHGEKHRGKHRGKQRRKLEKEIIQLEREISQVSDTCQVGDMVKCPRGEYCAGNQCCPNGSTCPSADNSFSGCPHEKNNDCTEDPQEECDPNNDNNGGGCDKGKCCWGSPPTCQACGYCINNRDCPGNKVCDNNNNNCIDPKLRLVPNDGDVNALFNRIKTTYTDQNSNGVFISIIFNNPTISDNIVYLDGSGSILRKDIYSYLLSHTCSFGFIWDTDWLNNNLVSCLFPIDAYTTPFNNCSMAPKYNNVDTCKLADTSKNGETPDRCSEGLQYYYLKQFNDTNPSPTNCKQNKKYIIDINDPHTVTIENNKNCFTSIVDEIKSTRDWLHTYNEAVFLKDIDDNGIEINKGIKKVTRLNKPKPVGLIYIYNTSVYCEQNAEYKKQLKALKLNFTPDTLVITIYYDNNHGLNLLKFTEYTTLDKMSSYNDV